MEHPKAVNWILLTVVVLYVTVIINAKRGFILTAPKVLKTGTIEHLTLTLFEIKKGGHVTIQLQKDHNDDVLVETTVFAQPDHSMWVELLIPNVPYNKAKLRINGSFHEHGYKIDTKKEVRLEKKSLLTFIQTDKPIYKPGQIVRFRVFPVDIKLEPVERNTVGDIWIENPSNIRVEQWKNVSFATGLIQLSLSLSEEAALGDWIIYSEILGKTEEQKFEVAKYVLPRFEVIATPPPYVLANASTVSWEVCARYTYGKKVDGILRGNVTYDYYHWEKTSKVSRSLPFVDFEKPISGCINVTINTADLAFSRRLYSRGLVLYSEVIENGTESLEDAISKIVVQTTPLKIKILTEKGNHFKPGIPYRGKVLVTTPDNLPAANELILICIKFQISHSHSKACKNFTSDEEGQIYFTIPPQKDAVTIIIIGAEAVHFPAKQHGKMDRSFASVNLYKWFSPSQSYIQIEPSSRIFSCEQQEEVKVIYTPTINSPTAATIKFYHQIISRGQIVKQGFHWRTYDVAKDTGKWSYNTYIWSDQTRSESHVANGEFILKFDSRSFMSPVARLLVFYIHPTGETVADSQEFRLNNCLPNKVTFAFDQRQQYPGSGASIGITAHPHSLCGITTVDKSVHLMKSGNKFTLEKIFDSLKKYDLDENTSPLQSTEENCQRKVDLNYFKGTNKIYDGDLRRRRRSSYLYFPLGADSMMAFEVAGMVVLSDLTLNSRPCHAYHPPMDMEYYNFRALPDPISKGEGLNDPFSIYSSPDSALRGSSTPAPSLDEPSALRSYFPETWLWELQDVGEKGEINLKRDLPHTITEWMGNAVCINHQSGLGISDTASIVTFKPFFVSIILPYSIVRGEKVPITVKVFNYLSYCLPIMLILEPNNDFKVINDSNTYKCCVCGSESATHQFTIEPNVLGNITLTVHGHPLDDDKICNGQYTALMSESDSTSRTLLVMAEGFYKEYTKTTYFCPKDYAEETFTENIDINLPDNLVKGSESAYFMVTGDIMGPSLSGLQKLVHLPVGCGEQNMVLFAPNIFVLDYLTATNRITDDVKSTIFDYMKTGYQRELNYRHHDGSYSAFGMSDSSGSIWLTAFVVKSFFQAGRYIDIDGDSLNSSIEWIVEQQLENGCFPTVGKLHNQAMKGGVGENQQTLTTLTAYIVVSLLESGMDKSSKVIKNALFCMSSEPNPTSYSLALFGYASALAKDQSAKDYLERLMLKATYQDDGTSMYWDSGSKSSHSISIETGAYAILTCLRLGGRGNIARALLITRWIVQLRNSNGGFASTQDTVIALQALAEYAIITSQTNTDISIIAEGKNYEDNFHLTETNKLVTQSSKVPVIPTALHIVATGDGCALIQVHQHYNVKNVPASANFQLEVVSFRAGTSGCNKPNIKICARYKVNHKTSNMAVIEAKMISGYVPDEHSLYMLSEREELALKRYEISNDNVVFYYDELSNEEKCFQFAVIQEFKIEDSKPAIVKLYDYYEQESFVAVEYTIESECLENIPNVDMPLNTTMQPTLDEIQQLDIEFVNTSAIVNNIDNSEIDEISESSTTVKPLSSRNPYDKFVDTNHELDFPDGLEGNVAFTVKPPQALYRQPVPPQPIQSRSEQLQQPTDGPMPAHLHAFTSRFCPLCFTALPKDFYDVYCNSAFALKIELRDIAAGRMKIIYDFAPRLNQIEKINAFAEYSSHPSCSCFSNVHKNLQSGMQFFIIGKEASLWQAEPEQRVILNNKVLVVPVPEDMNLPRHLKQAQNKCRNT